MENELNLEIGREYACTAPLSEVSFFGTYLGRNEGEDIFRTEDKRYLVIRSVDLEQREMSIVINDLLDMRPTAHFLKRSIRSLLKS